jgi:DNA repair protein RadA/Sms
MPSDSVVFGEIGLSGEVRPVGQADLRLKEAQKLGFRIAFTPGWDSKKGPGPVANMRSRKIEHIGDLIGLLSSDRGNLNKRISTA